MYYESILLRGNQIEIGVMGVWRGLALKAKHSQPPNHQLIKVAFRACPAKRKMLWHLAG